MRRLKALAVVILMAACATQVPDRQASPRSIARRIASGSLTAQDCRTRFDIDTLSPVLREAVIHCALGDTVGATRWAQRVLRPTR